MANILADLSLRLRANSAELSAGLENAKKQVKNFKDGITTTGKAMGEAFKSASAEIGGSLNHMTNGISGMLSSGLEMSRGLIAGITGIKSALISTGIGAIILGIVAAFSALVAAFKRSGEAGDAMAEVFAGLRGVVDFLIGKLVDLGEWIVKAFQSEPMQKFGSVLKDIGTRFGGFFKMVIGGFQTIINSALGASFAISGIFDKENRAKALEYFEKVKEGYDKIAEGAKQLWTGVNETPKGDSPLAQAYKDGKALEQLRDKLADDQRQANEDNKAAEIELGRIREELALTGKKSEKDRQKRIELGNKAIAIQNGITARNISLAKRGLEIVKQENKLRNDTSDAAKDAESNARIAVMEAEAAGREANRRMQQMITSNEEALDVIEEKNKEEKKSVELLRQEADEAYRLKTTFEGQRDALKKLWEEGKIGAKEYQDELDKIAKEELFAKQEQELKSLREELQKKFTFGQIDTKDFEKVINFLTGKVQEIPVIATLKGDLEVSKLFEEQTVPVNVKADLSAFKELAGILKEATASGEDFAKVINTKGKDAVDNLSQRTLKAASEEEAAFQQKYKGFSEENKTRLKWLEEQKRQTIAAEEDIQSKKSQYTEESVAKFMEETSARKALIDDATQYIIQKDNEEYTARWENRSNYIELVSDSINVIRDLTEAAYNSEIKQAEKRGASEEELEKIRVKYAKKQKGIAIAQALINGALAITNLLASVPGSVINPATWAAIGVAGAATAAQVALIASQPLAKGGIAYGETLATIGEYPGAQSNPEVVAPLDKLQTILSKVITEHDFIDDNTFSQKNLKRAFSQNLPRTRQIYGPAKRAANMSDNVPKFADGGLVSGPTIGIVGEYPGAQSNPEIMMPLKTIGSMLAKSISISKVEDIENSKANVSNSNATSSLNTVGKALAKSISTSIFNVGDTRSIESTLDTEDNNTYISNSSRNLRGLNIPKFAKGGIVYGETLATVGEYAGAINNPEVIAPLDKLRDMISPITPDFGDVKFVIEQNQLVGILSKANDKNIYF